jgi:hypothetical protein
MDVDLSSLLHQLREVAFRFLYVSCSSALANSPPDSQRRCGAWANVTLYADGRRLSVPTGVRLLNSRRFTSVEIPCYEPRP